MMSYLQLILASCYILLISIDRSGSSSTVAGGVLDK